MRDRLTALRKAARCPADEYDDSLEDLITQEGCPQLSALFREIDSVRHELERIKISVAEVRKVQRKIVSSAEPVKDDKTELEALAETVKTSAATVKKDLTRMSCKLAEKGSQRHTAEFRIRAGQHAALAKEFVNVMAEYNSVQSSYREQCVNRIQKQMEISGYTKTHDEVEEMLEGGNTNVFAHAQGILVEREAAQKALKAIEERHRDILKLEKNLLELHDMFSEMAILVEEQGEIVDSIENNVMTTVEYVQTAAAEIQQAVIYRKQSRWWCCCCRLL